jgi:hypothetical protein
VSDVSKDCNPLILGSVNCLPIHAAYKGKLCFDDCETAAFDKMTGWTQVQKVEKYWSVTVVSEPARASSQMIKEAYKHSPLEGTPWDRGAHVPGA